MERKFEENDRRREIEIKEKEEEIIRELQKEDEEFQRLWEKKQKQVNERKTIYDLPDWTVLKGGEWWYRRNSY
jgi:hypothetical protein